METYDNSAAAAGIFAFMGIILFFAFLFWLFIVICRWKIFEKAGKPGWAAIIPIYNAIVLLEIVGKPTWWIILFLIPGVNLIIFIIVTHELSLAFGQGGGFTILLILLPFIGYPILAFGSAQYTAPAGVVAKPIY